MLNFKARSIFWYNFILDFLTRGLTKKSEACMGMRSSLHILLLLVKPHKPCFLEEDIEGVKIQLKLSGFSDSIVTRLEKKCTKQFASARVIHNLILPTPNLQTDHAKHYIINPINPVRESETSSDIDVTTQMDFEETSVKHKINKDNHSPRPGHPRYLDLFDQPCSGAPIVIHLISKPKSFLLLGITEKLTFMNAISDTIGQVKAGTKWTHQGYLNVYPTLSSQKRKLLELKILKEFEIKCNLAISEASLGGVIRNVPSQDSEEDIYAYWLIKESRRYNGSQPQHQWQ